MAVLDHAFGVRTGEHLVGGAGLQVSDVAGVAVVGLLLALATGEADALGVHDHHEITGVRVRREEDVFLAAQQRRDARCEAAERLVGRVQHPPLLPIPGPDAASRPRRPGDGHFLLLRGSALDGSCGDRARCAPSDLETGSGKPQSLAEWLRAVNPFWPPSPRIPVGNRIGPDQGEAPCGSRGPRLAAVPRREQGRHRQRRARRPLPTSSSVPTRLRTMWRRKPVPSKSMATSPPSSPRISTRESVRTLLRTAEPTAAKAREVVGADQGAARLAHRREVERRAHPERRALAQRRARRCPSRVGTRRAWSARRAARETRRAPVRARAPRRRAAAARSARAGARRARDGSSSITLATCPSACTPASVRPAPVTVAASPVMRSSAASRIPCTVRAGPGWTCQPSKSVPSYSTSRRKLGTSDAPEARLRDAHGVCGRQPHAIGCEPEQRSAWTRRVAAHAPHVHQIAPGRRARRRPDARERDARDLAEHVEKARPAARPRASRSPARRRPRRRSGRARM